jgi:hypothetical protein
MAGHYGDERAVPLTDGRALVAGGGRSIDFFDPSTSTWAGGPQIVPNGYGADMNWPVIVPLPNGGALFSSDRAGSFLLKRNPSYDTTPPTVVGSPDRAPDVYIGDFGWWTGPVTVSWATADSESGMAGGNLPPTTVTAQGASTAVSAQACDLAGNCTTGSLPVRIDSAGPSIAVNGPVDGAAYVLGSAPTASCTASDALTGVVGGCTTTLTGGNANAVGTYTVTASATDGAGNVTTKVITYQVQYAWNGFEQPINDTAHQVGLTTSVFKAGSTVPTKFTLLGADGQAITPTATPLWVTPVKGVATTLPVDESVYSTTPDTGATYQGAGGHWQYNWKTSATQSGFYWRIGVRLDDGTTHYVNIALR